MLMRRPTGDPPHTQAVIVARCCSGVHPVCSAVGVTGAANAAPFSLFIPRLSHIHTDTVYYKLSQ